MPDTTANNSKIKVLVAEDDRFLSSLLKAKLEKEGFMVKIAYDGEEATSMLKEFKPDVMILDLIMPKISGFEFLEYISVDPQFNQIPVIVLSNLGQETDIERAKQLGVDDYFVKSQISIEDVVKAVQNLVVVGT